MSKDERITSFQPVIDNTTRLLILGTMPSVKSLEQSEYYGNKQNAFWKIIFSIFNKEMTSNYNEKISLLKKNNIGLWDVLKSCEREGSLDSKIQDEVPNDIKGLLRKYHNIKAIVFSSQKAAQYFKRHIGTIDNITFATMPSPSGANARMNLQEKIEQWEKIKLLL